MPPRSLTSRFALAFPAVLAAAVVSCSDDGGLAPTPAPGAPNVATASASANLVITEVLPNPTGEDPLGEWIEIYNAGDAAADLSGYTIGSFQTESHVIGKSVVVPAGGYVVLGNNASTATNGGITLSYAYPASGAGSIVLNNGGSTATEWVTLKAPGGVLVDSIAYAVRTNGTPGSYTVPNGSSRAVVDPCADNTIVSGQNWTTVGTPFGTGASKGTPGSGSYASCVVTPAAPIDSIGLEAAAVGVGATRQLVATAYDASRKPVVTTFAWSTTTPTVVAVSATGVVTGVAEGAASVTVTTTGATTTGQPLTATAPVTVVAPGAAASVSLSMNEPRRAPVGYTKPTFPTVRDADGRNVTSTTKLTWTSSAPDVATVDTLGYVTATGAGTAEIRATAPTGVFGAVTFTALPADAPTGARYADHLEFGTPADATPDDELLLTKPQFALSYNAKRGGPNWVSWNINASQFGSAPRCDCFSADLAVPADAPRIVDFDYRGGGYDRGHMVQSESRTATDQENASTFLLTNILPQAADNNQGPWSKFENYLNDLARQQGKEIYVVAGGLYAPAPPTLKGEGKVAIPDYTWKVALVVGGGQGLATVQSADNVQVLAIKMPNLIAANAPNGGPASSVGMRNNTWESYKTTVDQLEKETGYDFLDKLPDNIERAVEADDRPPVASVGGPYTGSEGSAITFDARGSTDPDAGDVLTYAWDFGDGTTGTGATASHTYADDGSYAVTVTVTDKAGVSDSKGTTATVANVAPTGVFATSAASGRVVVGNDVTLGFSSVTDPSTVDAATLTRAYACGAGAAYTTETTCPTSAVGTFVVRGIVTDKNGAFTEYPLTITVDPAPTSVSVAAAAGQYSDPVTLSASLSASAGPGLTTAPAGTMEFFVDGAPVGTEPVTATGTVTKVVAITQAAGAHALTARFTPAAGNPNYLASAPSAPATLTVSREDAAVGYAATNPAALTVASAGGAAGAFDLSVSLTEQEAAIALASLATAPASSAAAGDVNRAGLAVRLVALVGGGAYDGSCTPGAASGQYAARTFTCHFAAGVAVNTYTVQVSATGDYYAGGTEDVLTISDPSLGFITGGGRFAWPGTGERTTFGFTFKYNKSGSNPQGNVLVVRHLADGTIYRMKSNALDGLALSPAASAYGYASFTGKATFLEPRATTALGNYSFTGYVEDRAEPGANADRFWLSLRSPAGEVVAPLSLGGTADANAAVLSGGNVSVPHGAR